MIVLMFSQSVSDTILISLMQGPVSTVALFDVVARKRSVTKQAFYKSLRKLRDDEIVVIASKKVSLNIQWIEKMELLFEQARQHYLRAPSSTSSMPVTSLQERESVRYNFNSAATADAYWNHALYSLFTVVGKESPFVGYDPHCWFLLARPEQELSLQHHVVSQGRQYFIVSSYDTPGDRFVKKYFDNEMSQYAMVTPPLIGDQNRYLNIVGPYIVDVRLSPEVTEKIYAWYTRGDLTSSSVQELKKITKEKHPVRITITRNTNRAETLRKKFLKYFHTLPRR